MTLTVYSIDGVTPVVDPTAYVHPSAVLIGDVIVGPGCYIGPFASLRGDFGGIRVHAGANVQDCCIMHGFPGTDTVVEENGHIGHAAVLHSCVDPQERARRDERGGQRQRGDRRVGDRRCDGFRQGRHGRGAAHARCRHAGARRARADRAGARMEGLGNDELPGAHAPLPRDDAGDVAARRAGSRIGRASCSRK